MLAELWKQDRQQIGDQWQSQGEDRNEMVTQAEALNPSHCPVLSARGRPGERRGARLQGCSAGSGGETSGTAARTSSGCTGCDDR